MALVIDPAEDEVRELRGITDWRGKRVLEVGCGGGRLTQRLAGFGPEKITAFDPDPKLIRTARKDLPQKFNEQIEYRVGNAEHVKHKADQFDVVVFSWVL